jgi:hypothetical protein
MLRHSLEQIDPGVRSMIGTRRLVLLGGASLVLPEAARAKNKKNAKRKKKAKRKKNNSSAVSVDHDAILANLASQLRYGLRDDELSADQLESRLAQGDVVECQCSNQAWLGVRAVRRAGGRARMVGSFLYPFRAGPGDGHVMMEVYAGGQCFATTSCAGCRRSTTLEARAPWTSGAQASSRDGGDSRTMAATTRAKLISHASMPKSWAPLG